MIGSQIYMSAQ